MTRVIIITGAGSGIGQGTALTFAERGDWVVAADIDLTAAQRTLAGTTQPSAHMAVHCDVSDESSVQQMVASVLARYGRIDVLVNNAGILISKPLHLTSWPEWQRILNTNLGSVYLCSAAVLPTMLAQKAGAIINIASPHSFATTTNIAAYAASKGGVVSLTRPTSQTRFDTVTMGDVAPQHGRVGQPADIAHVIHWLAGPDAAFVLGAAIHADGGMLAQLTPPTE